MKNSSNSSDTITLKEIVYTTKEFVSEIIRKWWVIAMIAIPLVVYFAYKTNTTPVKYNATLRYVVEGNGGGSGGLGGLLGSFGFGGSSGGSINQWKILEVTKSRAIMDQVLLDTSDYNQKLVINNIIEEYKLDEKWAENMPELLGYRFKTNNIAEFTDIDRSRYKVIIGKMLGSAKNRSEALLVTSLHDEFGIYTLFSTTTNEDLCLGVINARNLQLANMIDRSRGAVSKSLEARQRDISTEILGLKMAYQEVYKSFELSDYNYKNSQPYFVPIDMPYKPLTPMAQSMIITILKALVLSGIIGVILIVLNKLIKDALQ